MSGLTINHLELAEFETSSLLFLSDSATEWSEKNVRSLYTLKGTMVESRKGNGWRLTGEPRFSSPGVMLAEYILDGTVVKLGQNQAGKAAKAIERDAVR